MKDADFSTIYRELKKTAQGRDALWNDWANEGPKQYDEETKISLNYCTDDLQKLLEQLITKNELTPGQVSALENIVYQTPGYPGATDVNVGRIDVMQPFSGVFEYAEEALGTFAANLFGAGATRVQGPKTGYLVVRIERPKTK